MNKYFILAIVCLAAYIIKREIYFRREKNMFDYVGWCMSRNPKDLRCGLRIIDYIIEAEDVAKIDSSFRITESEIPLVNRIIKQYKDDLLNDYLLGRLHICDDRRQRISSDAQFFYQLYVYLRNHESDGTVDGVETFTFIERQSYGPFSYDSKNKLTELTDMGDAFAKLLLICGAYCKRNPVLNPTGEKYNLQGIEERIKTGTIELSCYIP